MSIQWGAFAAVGLAAADARRGERLADRGLLGLLPEEGTQALFRLLARPQPTVGILRLRAHQWLESHPVAASLSYYAELRTAARALTPDTRQASARQAIRAAPAEERPSSLRQHVSEQVGRVLRLDPGRLDQQTPFSRLGLDSLLSLELRNRLEASLGIRLSATLLFTYPDISSLSRHLLTLLDGASEPARVRRPRVSAAVPPPPPPQLLPLSEAEAAVAMEAELSALEDLLQ